MQDHMFQRIRQWLASQRRRRRRRIISQQQQQERRQHVQNSEHRFLLTVILVLLRILIFILFSTLVVLWTLILDRDRLLGHGPTLQGGLIGRKIDNSIKTCLFYWRDWSRDKSVRQQLSSFYSKNKIGYDHLPACPEAASANKMGVPVLLNAYLEETIWRGMERRLLQENVTRLCPYCIHYPMVGDWYRPVESITTTTSRQQRKHGDSADLTPPPRITVIPYQESEMDLWMIRHFGDDDDDDRNRLCRIYQGWSRVQDRVQLWGILAVYMYGGQFQGPIRHANNSDADDKAFSSDRNFTFQLQEEDISHHASSRTTTFLPLGQPWIKVIASTRPRHYHLECLLQFIDYETSSRRNQNHHQQCSKPPLSFTTILHQLTGIVRSCSHPPCDCNQTILKTFMNHPEMSDQQEQRQRQATTVALVDQDTPDRRPRFQVEISASTTPSSTTALKTTAKDPQSEQLRRRANCSAGWLCNRCLKLPWRGSFASCASYCRPCYVDQICNQTAVAALDTIVIKVNVKEDTKLKATQKRIPRIIHQTWLEDLTAEAYPHLHRLQNSWKAQMLHGWDYRFYTDETMREYIVEHYSSSSHLFVDAYDALIPGAFRADFFRLLVLFKHGGIYADIDVQLDVSDLDYWIPHNLGYFVPRDVAIDRWPDSNFCLWNGFQGAAPGHPIVGQAIQDLLNHILNRHDYYDLESQHCQSHEELLKQQQEHDNDMKTNKKNLNAEIWKLRSFPLLLLTGPCALGVSVNTAMGRHDNHLQGFHAGWLVPLFTNHSSKNGSPATTAAAVDLMGDVLILLTDRYDLGEMRFTDIDRNILVASSNADKFSATRLGEKESASSTKGQQKTPVHYSKFEDDIVGSQGIYKDNQVLNKQIILQIAHSIID